MKFSLSDSFLILGKTPATIRDMLDGLSEEWTHQNEGEGTWSPFDVVGHLIHGEQTDWVPRTKIILFEEDKHFTPFDRFAQFEESQGKSMQELLNQFESLRGANLKELRELNLQETDFEKRGIHPEFGAVSIKQVLAAWVAHDLGHIMQISRVLAKQYKEETGPWPKYLRVLTD